MKKITTLILLVLFIFISATYTKAQKLSDIEKDTLKLKIIEFLNDYETYATFTETGVNISKDYKQKFLDLFGTKTNAQIYNDIGKGVNLRDQMALSLYVQMATLWYPKGINVSLNFETLKLTKFRKINPTKSLDAVIVRIEKTISAKHINGQQLSDTVIIDFDIHYTHKKDSFNIVQISGIYAEKGFKEKVSYKGLYIGGDLNSSMSFINYYGINEAEYWSSTNERTMNYGFKLHYFFKEGFAMYTGVSFNSFEASMKLTDYSNEFLENPQKDVDNDTYYLFVDANLNEINTIKYMSIPLGFLFTTGKPGSLNFYFKLGGDFSLLQTATYSANGSSTHRGYYPDYNIILFDIPEYGFTSEFIDESGDWTISESNIFAHVGLGFGIPMGKRLYLSIGGIASYGISDIEYNTAKHRDDFIAQQQETGKTNLMSGGIEIGLRYKLIKKK